MLDIRVLILTFAIFATVAVALQRPEEVRYQWKYLNYTWSSAKQYHDAVANSEYIPKNNLISGMKIWKGHLYLTVPRLRKGVPVALVTTPLKPVDGNRSPNLKPYPNWQMQKLGDCNAFQYVQNIEIDPAGRMWIIDTGRKEYLEGNVPLCPPRLVVLDLENKGKVLLNYQFPKNVVNPKTSLLVDLVLDHTDGGYIYIANSDKWKPAIVVYSVQRNTSWSMSHWSMYPWCPIIRVKDDNETVTKTFGIDGIALSSASGEGKRTVYYSPLSSYSLFSIPTDVLKKNPRGFGFRVKLVGLKPSQSDGMMMSANDVLYFGLLNDSKVSKWNTREGPLIKYQKRVYGDNVNLIWSDTFAIDEKKTLWVTANKLDKMFNDHIDTTQVNFRVVQLAQLDSKSYLYYEDGTAPQQPKIH